MNTCPLRIRIDNYGHTTEIDFPTNCPYCEKSSFIEPKDWKMLSADQTEGHLHLLYAPCCKKHFYSFTVKDEQDRYTLLHLYPSPTGVQVLVELQKLSPRFVKLYKGARLADEKGFDELAGAGYRNALEVLIKDYAIQILHRPEEEVAKKSLSNAIKSYLDHHRLFNAADVVRLLGNDFTHYERKYDQAGLSELRDYLQLFMNRIAENYRLEYPPLSRTDTP